MAESEVREPTFFVLAALASGPKHGYALIKETADLSGGRVSLRVGTLYAALDRLQEQGLVTVAGEEVVDGRHRRYFALSEDGAALLEAEAARLENNAKQARSQLRARRGHARAAFRVGA